MRCGGAVGPGRDLFPAGRGKGIGTLGPSGGGSRLGASVGVVSHLPESHNTRTQAIDLRLALRNRSSHWASSERLRIYLQEAEVLAEALVTHTGWGGSLSICSPILRQRCDLDRA